MSGFWTVVLVVIGAWGLWHWGLTHECFRLHWDKHSRVEGSSDKLAQASWLERLSRQFIWFLPLLLSSFAAQPLSLAEGMGLLMLPFTIDFALGWLYSRAERRAAHDPNPANLHFMRLKKLRQSLALLAIAIGLWIWFFGLLLHALVLCAVAVAYLLTKWPIRPSLAASFALEATPLRAEMDAVGRRFGVAMDLARVCPQNARAADIDTPMILHRKGHPLGKGVPLIPLRNFLELNPSALTAGLAVELGRASKPDSLLATMRNHPSAGGLGRLAIVLVLLLGASSVLMSMVKTTLVDPWETIVMVALGLCLLGFAVLMVVAVLSLLDGTVTASQALASAFEVWCDADTDAERDLEQFARAYAEYHAFRHAIHDPQLLLHRLQLDLPLRTMLADYGESDELLDVACRADGELPADSGASGACSGE